MPPFLSGQTIVVTREASLAQPLVTALEQAGANVVLFPAMSFRYPADCAPLDALKATLAQYDRLILTSPTAAVMLLDYLGEVRLPRQIMAVGPATAKAFADTGQTTVNLPETANAQGILEALQNESLVGQRILLPRSNLAMPALPDELRAMGAEVDEVVLYETSCPTDTAQSEAFARQLAEGQIDAVTFLSPSAVVHFQKRLENWALAVHNWLEPVALSAIGSTTAQAIERQFNRPADVIAASPTVDGLVQALVAYYQEKRSAPHGQPHPTA